jgi:hypothetical protein
VSGCPARPAEKRQGKGDPSLAQPWRSETPLGDEELEVKVLTNAGRALSEQEVDELRCVLEALGEAETMGDVTRLAGTRGSVRSDRGHAGG